MWLKKLYGILRERLTLDRKRIISSKNMKNQIQLNNIEQERLLNSIYSRYENFTMIPKRIFIENLRLCKKVANLDGCVVECGVWKGGMIAGITHILGSERKYYLFDSFDGLPLARAIDGQGALAWQRDSNGPNYHNNCKADIEYAEQAMKLSLAKEYELVKGWFSHTMPNFKPKKPIAVLRLDCDWYDSTLLCLNSLYSYVIAEGLIIIDDYYTWDGCSKAVHDFLSANKLPVRIYQASNSVCWMIKK